MWRTAARIASGLVLVALLAGVGAVLLARQPPGWYPAALRSDPVAANDMDQKLAAAMSWAGAQQAYATQRRRAGTQGDMPANVPDGVGPITLEFTAGEINSFLRKWLVNASAGSADQWVDPAVTFENGRIVLAGRLGGGSTVLSVSVELSIDAQGRMNATVDGERAGLLPVPGVALSGPIGIAEDSLQGQVSKWRSEAAIDGNGAGNAAAANLCLGQMGIALLESAAGRASSIDPIVMVPFDPGHANRRMPVRVVAIAIDDNSIQVRCVRAEIASIGANSK